MSELEKVLALGNDGAPEEWVESHTGSGIVGIETEGVTSEMVKAILAEEPIPPFPIEADPEIRYYQCNSSNFTYGREGCGIDWIVVHYTAGSDTSEGAAYANCVYFGRQYVGASAHYFIDSGYTIWQSVSEADTAWHAGNWAMNLRSIGIEVCTDGAYTDEEIDRLHWLVRHLMEKRGIDADHVIRHYDVTGKLCPAYYVDEGRWAWLHGVITEPYEMPDEWPVQMWESNGTAAQKWVPWHNADGSVSLESCAVPGKFLDVSGASANAGALLQIYPGNGTDAQKFELAQVSNDAYRPQEVRPFELTPKCAPKMRLDVASGSDAPGTKVQLWEPNGTPAQQWYVVDNGDGTWTLLANTIGRKNVLDVVGGGR